MSERKLGQATEVRPLLPRQPEVNIGTSGHVDHGKCERGDMYVLLDGVPVTGYEIMEVVKQRGSLLARVDGGEFYRFDRNSVVSIDENLQPVRAESCFYAENYKGPMYSIKSSTGRKLSVTPVHPLLVNRGGVVEWMKAKDLRTGDHLAFLSHVPLNETLSFDDPFPSLAKSYKVLIASDYGDLAGATSDFRYFSALDIEGFDKLRILGRLSKGEFCARAHIDQGRYHKLLVGNESLDPRTRGKMTTAAMSLKFERLVPGEFLVEARGGKGITKLRDVGLDSDLIKWFAFVWSEGSSGRNFIDVTQEIQQEMLKEFLNITREKFRIGYRAHDNRFRIYNTAFVSYLNYKFDYKPGNESVCGISTWLCRLPAPLKATFLRWFLTLDGEFDRHSGQIMVAQSNERNIVILSYLLHSFGIIPRFGTLVRSTKKGPKSYQRLTISGRRNLRLFADLIGFEDPVLQRRLRAYLTKIKQASKESDLSMPIDVAMLRDLFAETGLKREAFDRRPDLPTMKDSSWYKAYEGAARTGRISRPKLVLLVQAIDSQLRRIEESSLRVNSSNGRDVRRHMEIIGMPLERAAGEMGMSRKKLARVIRASSKEELVPLVAWLLKHTRRALVHVSAAVEQLRIMARTKLEFDRIVSIGIERYEGMVFDLSVPVHANFVGGNGAIVCHNTTLTQAITGVWASAHSEELKRGITIKVGYADAAFYRCSQDHGPGSYSTSPKCPVCGRETSLLRAVSFVDAPGHESLMTNMLAGAFLMDGALLVIAANEPVPKPQTREHLQALQMLGMKKIVVAQNKVDLVTDQEAETNYEQIRKFVEKTTAADAPIVPISAQQKLNIDALLEALEEVVPTPKRDPAADPLMYVVRSFDVNRPGMEVGNLSGGVLGGSLTRGELKLGEEVELRPGMVDERSGKYVPIVTKVTGLETGAGRSEGVGPGGLVAVGTSLDPTYTKGDQMVGSVIGKPGTLPPTWEHITLDLDLFETVVGLADVAKVDKVRPSENLRLTLGTASTQAVVTSARGDVIEVDLKKPVAVEAGMRAAVSRRIAERWRLIGSGVLK